MKKEKIRPDLIHLLMDNDDMGEVNLNNKQIDAVVNFIYKIIEDCEKISK